MLVSVQTTATGREKLTLANANLLSGSRSYANFGVGGAASAEPGFTGFTDLLFEVDPAQIDDLTLEIGRRELLSGYSQRVRLHLGITPDNADAWRAAARDQSSRPPRIAWKRSSDAPPGAYRPVRHRRVQPGAALSDLVECIHLRARRAPLHPAASGRGRRGARHERATALADPDRPADRGRREAPKVPIPARCGSSPNWRRCVMARGKSSSV